MNRMHAYYAVFVPNDGKVSVFFPDVPGCFPWGDTLEEAFTDAVAALEVHLEGLADDNDPVPAPSGRAEAWAKFQAGCAASGKAVPEGVEMHLVPAPELNRRVRRINISFRQHVLDKIDRKAEAAGMTRSGFLARAADAYEVEQRRR